MDGQNWRGLKWIEFFKFISVYIKMSFTKLENHSQLLQLYVAVILQMKDSCSTNLTFRAHN